VALERVSQAILVNPLRREREPRHPFSVRKLAGDLRVRGVVVTTIQKAIDAADRVERLLRPGVVVISCLDMRNEAYFERLAAVLGTQRSNPDGGKI